MDEEEIKRLAAEANAKAEEAKVTKIEDKQEDLEEDKATEIENALDAAIEAASGNDNEEVEEKELNESDLNSKAIEELVNVKASYEALKVKHQNLLSKVEKLILTGAVHKDKEVDAKNINTKSSVEINKIMTIADIGSQLI